MGKKISVANLVMLAGGVVTLLFSFFGFYKYSARGFGSKSYGAWSTNGGRWVSTIPAILALAMIVWGALELAGQKLPDNVLTFNSNQLKATWGLGAAGVMLAFLISDTVDKGFGFYFMLIGSLAMAVGAVMALLGKGTETVNLGGGTSSPSTTSMGGGAPPPPPPMMGGGAPPPPPPGA